MQTTSTTTQPTITTPTRPTTTAPPRPTTTAAASLTDAENVWCQSEHVAEVLLAGVVLKLPSFTEHLDRSLTIKAASRPEEITNADVEELKLQVSRLQDDPTFSEDWVRACKAAYEARS